VHIHIQCQYLIFRFFILGIMIPGIQSSDDFKLQKSIKLLFFCCIVLYFVVQIENLFLEGVLFLYSWLVSDLQRVGCFLLVLWFPPPMKLTATI
jgi:hypothetical protein